MKDKKRKIQKNAGFTLAELMIVVAIISILAAVSIPVYRNSVQKAEEAVLLTKGRQIKEALLICEMEYQMSDPTGMFLMTDYGFTANPSQSESVLYPYIGEFAEDCVNYSLRCHRKDGRYCVKGFIYETDQYEIRWMQDEEITVTKKE